MIALLGTVSLPFPSVSIWSSPPPDSFLALSTASSTSTFNFALLPSSDLLCPHTCWHAHGFSTWISLEFDIDSEDFLFFSAPFHPSLYLSKLLKLKSSLLLYCRKAISHPVLSPKPSLTPIHPFSLTTKDFAAFFKEITDRQLTHLLPTAHQLSLSPTLSIDAGLMPHSPLLLCVKQIWGIAQKHPQQPIDHLCNTLS